MKHTALMKTFEKLIYDKYLGIMTTKPNISTFMVEIDGNIWILVGNEMWNISHINKQVDYVSIVSTLNTL